MKGQNLLFEVPKNFHLQYLYGKPVGKYSLRKYCTLSIEENGLTYYHEGVVYRRGRNAAIQDKIALQKELMTAYKNGDSNNKPFWQKQREHYKKFLKAAQDGNVMTTLE